MSAPKFTPGPWTFHCENVDPSWHIAVNRTGMRIVANVQIEDGNQTDLANAQLIAAAPDLYAALEACLGGLRDGAYPMAQEARIRQAQAALAKARGAA